MRQPPGSVSRAAATFSKSMRHISAESIPDRSSRCLFDCAGPRYLIRHLRQNMKKNMKELRAGVQDNMLSSIPSCFFSPDTPWKKSSSPWHTLQDGSQLQGCLQPGLRRTLAMTVVTKVPSPSTHDFHLALKLYQHRPQIAWKGISDIPQFVSSRFTRYILFHRYISGQETNQNTDIKYDQTDMENYIIPAPRIPTRIPTRTGIRWHLPWQPSLRSANPWPLYTHQLTASMTARSWICEPWPLHTPKNTPNDSLCDSPPRNESTKFCEPSAPNLK